MLCEICKKKVKTRRTINNLFDPEIHHICEKCYMENPLIIRKSVIPIEDGMLYIHQMLGQSTSYPNAYMSLMKPFYLDFIRHLKTDIMLYFDQTGEQIFEILDSLKLGSIYLLTLYENIGKGEKL